MAANLKKAAEAAMELLLNQRLYNLRMDVRSFRHNKNIVFDSFSGFCSKTRAKLSDISSFNDTHDGCTIIKNSESGTVYVVLYNDRIRSAGRRSFTLAHEIGHIYLGHKKDDNIFEIEANHFAAQLLLPPPLVWELYTISGHRLTAGELADIFAVSKEAAGNRLNTIKHLQKNEFSENERLIIKKFGGLLPELNGPIIDC